MSHQPELNLGQPSPEQAARDAELTEHLKRLRENLKDPEFRTIHGFPIGEDEDILANCVMPTHYHLLVCPKTDHLGRPIPQPFSLSYTKAVNKQQERVGPLFQGRFQAVRVDRNEYLLHLSGYIHVNPVAAGLVARPEEWGFSSYRDCLGVRQGTLPVPDLILSQFLSRQAYREYVESYHEQDTTIVEHLLFEEN